MSILKDKFPSDKINVTKNALFFISQAPTHHSFTFAIFIQVEAQVSSP